MQFSISINGGWLTWPRLKSLAPAVEDLGFSGLYCADHFGRLEAMVSLAYLASHSRAIHIGTLVSPLSFRDPVMVARQAATIDDLSGGRTVLGLGAGWVEGEHVMFGYILGDVPTRMARFEEGVEVIARLVRSPEPVTFDGRFYHLRDAQLHPRPRRPTPLLVGGNGPQRTLPLAARYADLWNCQLASPAVFKQCSAHLDDMLRRVGRRPGDVRRTVLVPVLCGRDEAELERMTIEAGVSISGKPPDSAKELLESLRVKIAMVAGTPEQVIGQLREYEAVGADELIIAHITADSTLNLETIARYVMPYFSVSDTSRDTDCETAVPIDISRLDLAQSD